MTPVVPESPVTPVRALSNLLVISICRTPRSYTSTAAVDLAAVQLAVPRSSRQPSGRDTSMPSDDRETAAVHDARACSGSVTMRNHPRPGPPFWASM